MIPELIIATEIKDHTIMLEWKEGANTDADQLARYASITGGDLQTKALLPVNVSSNHDVCIVGKDEHLNALKNGIQKGNFTFPLITVSTSTMILSLNKFSIDALNNVFTPKLSVDLSKASCSFIPFNENSKNWEIAEIIIPHVIQQMFQPEKYVILEDLCKDAIPSWSIIGPEKKRQFRPRIEEILTEASKNEFRRYLLRNKDVQKKTNHPTWEIRNNPLDGSSTKRSREFKRLKKLQTDFLNALRAGRRPNSQVELFE